MGVVISLEERRPKKALVSSELDDVIKLEGGPFAGIAAAPEGAPAVDFSQIRVQMHAANPSRDDVITSFGSAEEPLLQYLALFGFSRLPTTYGELFASDDYCERLFEASGLGFPSLRGQAMMSRLKTYQRVYSQKWLYYYPDDKPALEHYCAQDLAALRRFHESTDTMARIGLAFTEFDE